MKIEPGSPDILGTNKTLAAEQRQVKSNTLVAQIKPQPGHTVFEFDLATGQVQPATIESVTVAHVPQSKLPEHHIRVMGNTSNVVRKKVVQRPQCLYVSALNKKNAIKKFIPMYDRLKKDGHIITKEV